MTTKHILPIAIALLSTLGLQAGGNHSHEKKVAGPNGGRLLTSIEPHAEFLLLPDRKVQITFVDDHAKPIPPAEQVVTVTTGERSAPLKLVFVKTDSALVSEQSVPAGNKFPVVVQIKANPESKTLVEKFTLDLSTCSGCGLAEYACTCAEGH
jgi:hypothetical protein